MDADLMSLIGNYGFPIFVTCWFMFRTEKIIGRNTDALDKLSNIVEELCKKRKI
jgi:hypothetical protein